LTWLSATREGPGLLSDQHERLPDANQVPHKARRNLQGKLPCPLSLGDGKCPSTLPTVVNLAMPFHGSNLTNSTATTAANSVDFSHMFNMVTTTAFPYIRLTVLWQITLNHRCCQIDNRGQIFIVDFGQCDNKSTEVTPSLLGL
jgi:hypothetical protein